MCLVYYEEFVSTLCWRTLTGRSFDRHHINGCSYDAVGRDWWRALISTTVDCWELNFSPCYEDTCASVWDHVLTWVVYHPFLLRGTGDDIRGLVLAVEALRWKTIYGSCDACNLHGHTFRAVSRRSWIQGASFLVDDAVASGWGGSRRWHLWLIVRWIRPERKVVC